MTLSPEYSVPREASKLFVEGILNNAHLAHLPAELKALGQYVEFGGSDKPSIPINWRFAESISALKALEATFLNLLLTKKYNIEPVKVKIDTDHASLFFMSPVITRYLKDGVPIPMSAFSPDLMKMIPSQDKHRSKANLHRSLATNIYKTKDGRYYHTHGSMNPDHSLTALGLPLDGEEADTYDDVVQRIQKVVSEHNSTELDELMNEKYRQAGTIAYTSAEYFASEHGKAAGQAGLFEISRDPKSQQAPSWWDDNASNPASPRRPLAGLKVVDLSRVIAAPSITRGLAEMGASVMRVVSPHVTDLTAVLQDLNWGKWTAFLHLKDEADKEKLRALIREADVVVDGYRPGVMDRLGFGREAVFDLVKDRPRGIIYVRENCYGWHGPWTHRSGWQQISDACCGVSKSYAEAMGVEGAVTPVFPNSDYCTGVCGTSGVLDALVRRGTDGGSYAVDVSLNYYSQWLVRSCGTYPKTVWDEVWTRHGSPKFQHYHAMPYLIPAMLKILHEHDAKVLFNPDFFEQRVSKVLDTTFIQVKPIAQFPGGEVELKYTVGTRGNGVDEPVWPEDLTVETVTAVASKA